MMRRCEEMRNDEEDEEHTKRNDTKIQRLKKGGKKSGRCVTSAACWER